MIERKILIGLITSSEFINEVHEFLTIRSFKSTMAKRLAVWVFEYYQEYQKAPGRDIENIFYQKVKDGLPKDIAEDIEQNILPSLNDEYMNSEFDTTYLVDQTKQFVKESHITQHIEKIQDSIKQGKIDSAENEIFNFKPVIVEDDGIVLDLSSDKAAEVVSSIFNDEKKQVLSYPGALGKFMNAQLVKGGFVAFMAPEKRGKTWWLLDMALRAFRKGSDVLFVQAGDMTQKQQMNRLLINFTGKSDKDKFVGEQFQCVPDCRLNQTDNCLKRERTCSFGIFTDKTKDDVKEIQLPELIDAFNDNPDYIPCTECADYENIEKELGVPYLEKVLVESILTESDGLAALEKYIKKRRNKLYLATYSNNTLTVTMLKNLLKLYKKKKNFIPELIVIDYADLMVPETKYEFRHQQNEIWKGLRSLSQDFDCLVVTATQADADSYKKDTLGLSNFSEDKRKYAHVTAMYGMNQDKLGREKRLGLLRINELVIREDVFDVSNKVVVIQNLKRGRPVINSYF